MKEGWEYKKIKDVALVVGGSTPKTNIDSYWGEGHFWVTPAELDGSKYISKTVRTITDKAVEKTNLSLLPVGTVLLSSRAPIGKVCITKKAMYCNQGFKNLVCGERLYNEYAYYFLKHNVSYIQSLGTGATFKEISKKVVEGIEIPVPPLSEQQHIVEELDLLSSIIEKKKAQLKELDNLAQSIFYEMFGDPITNEKGWEVKKLGDIGLVKTGPFGSILHKEDYISNGIPLVNPIHMKGFRVVADMNFTISNEKAEDLCNYILHKNDIVFARRGDIGRCAVISENENGYLCGTGSLFVRFEIDVDSYYIMYMIRCESFTKDIILKARGVTMLNINSNTISNLTIPLPPLPLQELFASKIQSIEHQKDLIKQSITEVETLFNSRMDYYFN